MSLIMGRDKIKAIGLFCSTFIRAWFFMLILALILMLPTKLLSLSAVLGKHAFSCFSTMSLLAIGLIGIFVNVFAIISIVRRPMVRSASRAFIINLCVADLMFYCCNLPFAATNFIDQDRAYKMAACVTISFLRYFNLGLTLLTVAALAINRCIRVVNPVLYKKVYQTSYIAIMIACLWILALGMTAPTIFSKCERYRCGLDILTGSPIEMAGSFAELSLFGIGFMIPCLVIMACYGHIYWEIRKSLSRNMSSVIVSDHKETDGRVLKQEIGIFKIVLLVFVSFLLCYLPIVVIKAVDPDKEMFMLHIAGYHLLYLRACANPLIYAISKKHYRNAYRSLLQG